MPTPRPPLPLALAFAVTALAALLPDGAGAAVESTPPVLDTPARAFSVGALPKGAPAPSFTVSDFSAKAFDLKSYLGKNALVISFWSIYCDSCVKEMLALQKLEDKYKGKGLTILALNEDTRVPNERIVRFLDRLGRFRGKISYPLLFDKDSAVFNAYKGTVLPTTVLIDKEGKVVSSWEGFDPASEPGLLEEIEAVAAGKPVPSPGPEARVETFTVLARTPVCGFFDKSGWRKSFTGNTSLETETAAVRAIALREAQRLSVQSALAALGITLHSRASRQDCVDGRGIHVDRDPLETEDPLSKLLSDLRYPKFFEVVEDQEKLIEDDYYILRTVRVNLDDLLDELTGMGYLDKPIRINFTYVNMSRIDQKEFIESLLSQSRFIGKVEDPIFTPATTSQAFEIYAPTQGFAKEIEKMSFGKMKVFVEEVSPASLELEVWK